MAHHRPHSVPYALDATGTPTYTYYADIGRLTDRVLHRADKCLRPITEEYHSFLTCYGLEEPRSIDEYVFELLDAGVLWARYGKMALNVRCVPYRSLSALAEWRKRHQRLKPGIDVVRGILTSLLLIPRHRRNPVPRVPRLAEMSKLLLWLEATGDFREDALRLIRWFAFWSTKCDADCGVIFRSMVEFAEFFEQESLHMLGQYTGNVESFLRSHSEEYRWREDRLLCLRSRVEYHLAMVGAEIMNRVYRSEFVVAKERAVLVPGCMRTRNEKECTALRTPEGLVCRGCTPSCAVNRLRMRGVKQGCRVVVVPHASDVSRWVASDGREQIGVVGVACVGTLVGGGWELKRHNIPAQCVVLNSCGCARHWMIDGKSTEVDVRELDRIMS